MSTRNNVTEEIVRVLKDSKTMDYDSVPRSQVPRGYIKIRLLGQGIFFTDLHSLKPSSQPRHSTFSAAVKIELKRLHGIISCVYPVTEREWEDGFRMDMHPWKEIALWEVIAFVFQRFTSHLSGNLAGTQSMRKDVFTLIQSFVNMGEIKANVRWQDFRSLKAKKAKELHNFLFFSEDVSDVRQESESRYRELFREEVLEARFPERVTINSLLDETTGINHAASFDVWECLGTADVIFGEDVASQHRFLVYGRDLLEASGGEGERLRVLTVELDQETEELEKLISLVYATKGRHDYRLGGPSIDDVGSD